MGIQGLTKLLADNAPSCIKEQKFEHYFGRKIAVDASMHIYQFMVVVGRVGDQLLSNDAGEVTSHLQGMFFRTVRMLEAGIKPVYVFDGKPPKLKQDQLAQRLERRQDATEALNQAKESGDAEAVEKYSKRTVRVTKEHNEECKRLLRLMGVPVIDAPSEAEAQCAEMAKGGVVYGLATEDMDALTFGAPRVIRHLMAPSSSTELGLTEDQFIDMCILCGCDYCSNIRGIGPIRALQLIKKHGNIESVVASLDPEKYPLPDLFPYKESRDFFKAPEFLVTEKNFNEDRVRKAVGRMIASKGKANQGRMESFFSAVPKAKPEAKAPAGGAKDDAKRKAGSAPGKAAPAAKKGKSGVGRK